MPDRKRERKQKQFKEEEKKEEKQKENNKKGKKLQSEQQSSLSDTLLDEVQLMILSKLKLKDLTRVSRVSKKLRSLASDERVWKQLWLRDFGKHYKKSKENI